MTTGGHPALFTFNSSAGFFISGPLLTAPSAPGLLDQVDRAIPWFAAFQIDCAAEKMVRYLEYEAIKVVVIGNLDIQEVGVHRMSAMQTSHMSSSWHTPH